MNVSVNVSLLRKDLEAAGIIQGLGSIDFKAYIMNKISLLAILILLSNFSFAQIFNNQKDSKL